MQKLVVAGNGMAGMRVVETLLEQGSGSACQYQISVFGEEPHGNYNRIQLSSVLAGEKSIDDIMLHNKAWYQEKGVQLFCGSDNQVVDIDREARCITTANGQQHSYDKLLLATGSKPFIPPISGIQQKNNVLSFRDISDVQFMLNAAESNQQRAIVIGGGLLGLEAAVGLRKRGMSVTVVHNNDVLMNRQLDETAGKWLQAALEERGIDFKLDARTVAVEGDEQNNFTALTFDDGSTLSGSLLVVAVGIRPNIQLAKNAGLSCDRGIEVDETLKTSDPDIYAVGECVQFADSTFGLVAPLYEQAGVCAQHLLSTNCDEAYSIRPMATKLKVTGIDLFSAGLFSCEDGCNEMIFKHPVLGIYKKLITRESHLVGAVLYGDTVDSSWYQELIDNRVDVSGFRQTLMFGKQFSEENSNINGG